MPRKPDNKSFVTLVGVKSIVNRPHKANIEIRLSSSGYAVTIVSRDAKYLLEIAQRVKESGYIYNVYVDDNGFTRIHLRNLDIYDVVYIEKIVREALSKKRQREESLLALATH